MFSPPNRGSRRRPGSRGQGPTGDSRHSHSHSQQGSGQGRSVRRGAVGTMRSRRPYRQGASGQNPPGKEGRFGARKETRRRTPTRGGGSSPRSPRYRSGVAGQSGLRPRGGGHRGTVRGQTGARDRARQRRQHPAGRPQGPYASVPTPKSAPIPAIGKDTIRIVPLGGVEEIGRNMTVIETYDDIVIVDCGIQFKGEETPGIDYILPNTKYLEERKDKIRGIFITHGHLDHIGGIPYIVPIIGNPPVYTRNLTALMIKKRQEEFPQLPALDIRIIEKEERIRTGGLFVRFFSVTHTIPDSMGIILETPYGSIVHTGDLKLDHVQGVPVPREEKEFGIFKNEKVLLLMADSTNVERPGFSIPERNVFKNLEEIITAATGRLIIGTFASQIERIAKIIEIAEQNNKKVVVDGHSMKVNVEIARLAKVLSYKKETLVPVQDIDKYPPEKIVALVTGAQGDEYAVLMRLANKSHKYLHITPKDTVVLSSSIIPGNERSVQKLKDNLSRQGAKIIHYQVSEVHSSGHANRDETKWIHKKIAPKFFFPIHGYHYMLRVHTEVAREAGTPEKNIIVPDNGMVIEIQNKGEKITALKETAAKGLVMVDGFSVGDIQEVVIRDRQMLAQDGIFVVVVTIDVNNGKIRKSPDLISRGFVYLRESQELLQDTRIIIKKTVEDTISGMRPINFDYVRGIITDKVSQHLFEKTNKRPMVIPVILGV